MSFAAALQAYRDADYAKSGALLESAIDAGASALRSMSAVRRVLSVGETHHNLDLDAIQDFLGTTLSTPQLEGERLFIRGWLSWLDGAFAIAAGFLAESLRIRRDNQESSVRAEAAYWLARVWIQLRRKDAHLAVWRNRSPGLSIYCGERACPIVPSRSGKRCAPIHGSPCVTNHF